MATLDEIIGTPGFDRLSITARRSILTEAGADTSGLSDEAIQKLTVTISPETPSTIQSSIEGALGGIWPNPRQVGPGPLKATEDVFGPGSMVSPENVGIGGGAAMGARIAAPAGPLAAAGGAVIGGGIGAILGRYGETGTIGPHLGEAANRGMVAAAAGEGIGASINRNLQRILAPFAKHFGIEERAAVAEAKKFGLKLSPSEALESSAVGPELSVLERQPERYLNSLKSTRTFQREREEAVLKSATNMAETLSPGTAKDVQTVSDALRESTAHLTKGLKRVGENVAGVGEDLLTAGEGVLTATQRRFLATKDAGHRLYRSVAEVAGERADNIVAPGFLDAAKAIGKREADLAGMQSAGAPMANRIIARAAGQETMPAQMVKEFGLDKPKTYNLDALREWRSRLLEAMRTTKDRNAKRDYATLLDGVSSDIEKWGANNPDVKPLLEKANEFWRKQVAEVFYKEDIIQLSKTDPDMISKFFIRPQGSVVPLRELKAAAGPEAYDKLVAAHFRELARQSETSGLFDVDKYLGTLTTYRPEVLEQLLGKNVDNLAAITRVFKSVPEKLIKAINSKEGDKLLGYLVRPQGSVEPLQQLQNVLPPDTYKQFAAATWKQIVTRSIANDGQFSLGAFLTATNSRSGYTPLQLRQLLGPQYGNMRELVDVLERIKRAGGLGVNPSGTGGAVLSAGQIISGINLGGDIVGGAAFSAPVKTTTTGLILMHPWALGKVLFSEGGIKWLTEGFKMKPGTEAAIRHASKLGSILGASATKNVD